MKIGSILLMYFLFCFQAQAQDVITVTKTISRSYSGTIGQKSAYLNLAVANTRVSGEYICQGVSAPMDLSGTLQENKLDIVATPISNYPGPENANTAKGTISGTLTEDGEITGSLHVEGNSNSLDIHLNKVFEVSYIDTALNAAFINHNPDFKTDTVYTLSLEDLQFLNLPYRSKLRSLKNWYSYPFISIMAHNNYKELNEAGGVKLEEMGFQDGDYLLQQKKAIRHPQFPYHYNNKYSVAYVDQRFLSVKTDIYVYDGASHPFKNQTYKSYDLITGDSLKLDSLFLRGGKYFLDSVGEICFRKQTGIGPTADLATAGYFWNDSMFHVNNNFYFTISGICFVYNTYEIASYNVGVTKFIIPYEMLKPIIRRRGPLGWVRNE